MASISAQPSPSRPARPTLTPRSPNPTRLTTLSPSSSLAIQYSRQLGGAPHRVLLLSRPPRKRWPFLGRPTGATVAPACESRPLARLLLDGPWDTRRVLLLSRGAGPGWVPRGIALIYASLARRPLFPLLSWISSRQPSVYFGLRSLMHTSSNRSNSSGVAEDACEPNCASHRGGIKPCL